MVMYQNCLLNDLKVWPTFYKHSSCPSLLNKLRLNQKLWSFRIFCMHSLWQNFSQRPHDFVFEFWPAFKSPTGLPGGGGLLVCSLSVSPSVTLQFSRLFSVVFWDIDKFLQELLPFAKIQISRFFSVTFWDIDLKFGIWICLNIIQIKFEFCHAWPTFTGVIALC